MPTPPQRHKASVDKKIILLTRLAAKLRTKGREMMNLAEQQRVDLEPYLEALEKATPDERADFFAELCSCGDRLPAPFEKLLEWLYESQLASPGSRLVHQSIPADGDKREMTQRSP